MKNSTTTLTAAGLLLLLGAAGARAYDPAVDPTFVIKTSPVVLAAGNDSEEVLIEGTNLQDAGQEPLVVRNLGQGSSEIRIGFSGARDEFQASDGTRYWRVTLSAEGLPAEQDLALTAGISWGPNAGVADYTVSTKTQGALTWTVTPPKKQLRLQQTREISFPVQTGDRAVELALAGSSLQDGTTFSWMEDDNLSLRLASERRPKAEGQQADAAPGEAGSREAGQSRRIRVQLPANAATNVVLELGGEPPAGTYTGAVTFSAVGSTATQSFDLEVYSSPWGRRWGGALLILLGVAISFFVTVVARGLAKRLQTLRAARLVAVGLEPLGAKLEAARAKTGQPIAKLGDRLAELLADLGPKKLEAGGYLPPRVPMAIAGDDERTESFKSHLQTKAGRARVLDEIVRSGVGVVAGRWDASDLSAYQSALDELEGLADSATPDTVAADVDKALAVLPPLPQAVEPAEPQRRPSPRELQLRLDYLYGSVWLIWAAVTVAGGIGVLILPDPGFGTPMNLLTCFFWGLGVQTAGNGLQSLTPGSVQSTLKITAPPVDP